MDCFSYLGICADLNEPFGFIGSSSFTADLSKLRGCKKGPAKPLGQRKTNYEVINSMDNEEYATGFKHASDRLMKAMWDLKGLDANEPETRGALRAEVRLILEQLDVAKDLINQEARKRLGD